MIEYGPRSHFQPAVVLTADLSVTGAARTEDAQGTPTIYHQVYWYTNRRLCNQVSCMRVDVIAMFPRSVCCLRQWFPGGHIFKAHQLLAPVFSRNALGLQATLAEIMPQPRSPFCITLVIQKRMSYRYGPRARNLLSLSRSS